MDEKEYKRLLNKAAAYCAKAEKSPKEVSAKLRQWSREPIEDDTIEQIITTLTKEKFVDEERYAEKYIGEKLDLLHKGPRMLSQELAMKGIPSDIIHAQLSEIPHEAWAEAAEAYLSPKLEGYRRKAKNSFDLRMRLSRAAHGRGFSSNIIDEVLGTFDLTVEGADGSDEYYD